MKTEVRPYINLLGFKGKDRVTGFEGVITSISFDLYGCVQVILNPGVGVDGKLKDANWFDVVRVEITSKDPVMRAPDFEWVHGAETKPVPMRG